MGDRLSYVGLDVHNNTIGVALAESDARGAVPRVRAHCRQRRSQLSGFLLRHGRHYDGRPAWTKRHRRRPEAGR
jgi:hypothetical protein